MTYNIEEAIKAQERFCDKNEYPYFVPDNGTVGTAIRIYIPKTGEPDTVRKHMVFQ